MEHGFVRKLHVHGGSRDEFQTFRELENGRKRRNPSGVEMIYQVVLQADGNLNITLDESDSEGDGER